MSIRTAPRPALACLLALLALPAWAAPDIFPSLVDVVDVRADDVLNIRAEPGTRGAIVGTLPPGATAIEVVGGQDGWLRVNAGEASGWISARYTRAREDVWQQGAVPATLSCYGTEPFWALGLDGDALRYSEPEGASRHEGLRILMPQGAAPGPERALLAQGVTALIAPAPGLCSDGMSDRLYGLDARLLIGEGEGTRLLQGCCSIAGH